MILAARLSVTVLPIVLASALYYSKDGVRTPMISGTVEARKSFVGSQIGGRVGEVKVQEGQRVRTGDVLMVLEQHVLKHRAAAASAMLDKLKSDVEMLEKGFQDHEIGEAAAEVAQAQAHWERLRSGARKQEIDVARAELQTAKTAFNHEARNVARMAKLVASKTVTAEDFEAIQARRDEARSRFAACSSQLELLLAGTHEQEIREAEAVLLGAKHRHQGRLLGRRTEEVAAKRAELRASEAQLAEINAQIEELVVRAPMDGIVERINVHLGDLALPGASLASVVDARDCWVRTYVPVDWNLQVGDVVRCQSLSGEKAVVEGRVSFIAADAEFMPESLQTTESRSRQVYAMNIKAETLATTCRPGTLVDIMPQDHAPVVALAAK